ncbi:MAG: proteasome assembly chaperone family protein [Thermoproteota archaeon]
MPGRNMIIEEVETRPEKPIILEGFPDTGLVGTISLSHYLVKQGFERIGYMQTEELPPMLIIRDGRIGEILEIYYKDNVYIIRSELPIPQRSIYRIVDELLNWIRKKEPMLVLSLGGIPNPYRLDIADPKVYAVPTTSEALSTVSKMKDVELLSDGILFGPKALLLKEMSKLNISGIGFFVESYVNYPDPGSAAKILTILPQIGLERVEVDSLLASAEEIRMKYRELMRRTEEETRRMRQIPSLAERTLV